MGNIDNSGDGSRPMTDGAADNIGAGKKFSTKRTQAGGEVSGPAPAESMASKRKDLGAAKRDDSAPFELHEDDESEPNTERPTAP